MMNPVFTDKNPRYFYTQEEFPELDILCSNFSIIKEELLNLISQHNSVHWLNTFPNYLSPDSVNQWKVFTFRFFGIRHLRNSRLCHQSASVLNQIPGLISADFSYLPAQTKILPHVGFTKMVLRVHLGLIIPENCGIRVGDEERNWKEGQLLIFDDSFEHEAWNNSNSDRFVLMLDIANPLWGYSAEEICKYKIDNLQDEFMLKLFPKEKWIEFYRKGEFDVKEMK